MQLTHANKNTTQITLITFKEVQTLTDHTIAITYYINNNTNRQTHNMMYQENRKHKIDNDIKMYIRKIPQRIITNISEVEK